MKISSGSSIHQVSVVEHLLLLGGPDGLVRVVVALQPSKHSVNTMSSARSQPARYLLLAGSKGVFTWISAL